MRSRMLGSMGKNVFPTALEVGLFYLTLLPTGGGGFLSHTTIVLAGTLKPLMLWLPNFVTSCFYLLGTI